MDDTQARNHEHSDVDRNSTGGAVPEGDEADLPDQPTVDDWSDDEAGSRIDVGVLVAHSPGGDVDPLRSFAERMARDGVDELAAATDAVWRVHCAEPDPLTDRNPRRPSEFLDEAVLHMVKRPYDLVVVVTDVPLTTRQERSVEGLASPLARVVVVSTRRLLRTHDREAVRALDSPAVRWNAATLLVHLLGHVFRADHNDGGVMAPFSFDPSRRSVPPFDADITDHLREIATRIPQADVSRGRPRRLALHAVSLMRNPGIVAATLLQSRAPLLPFSLPRLSTAAVTPTLILVFSAEAWDVGLNLTNRTAALFAIGSVIAAAVHLLYVQRLTFPRERNQVLTEHMALVNVAVFLILVVAMMGLFVLVGSIILLIEFAVFPPNLMTNWPSLEEPTVGLVDLVRVGGFISTLGVLSGALAGGIENRMALRHLALFRDRP
jgi:Predicted Zn-dependent proteases